MDEYYRYRRITGEKYNIFDKQFLNIMNIQQAAFYMNEGAELWDVYPSRDKFTGKPTAVFVFKRDETKEVYDKWCKLKDKQE